jgi:arylsulfatase A-like enzyme
VSTRLATAWLAALGLACHAEAPAPPVTADAPNVIFVVWDTVRADRLSLYGHSRETTPKLDAWAQDALVFEDARATASSTVPTHASLFTGLLPSEHGAHAGHQRLDDRFTTLAELFQGAGYRTFLWASNPHVSRAKNFAQGFDVAEHP